MSKLEEQIKVVAEARAKEQVHKGVVDDLRFLWEKSNATILTTVAQAKVDVSVEEAKLREPTLKAYAETGDKAPAPGVGIRERTVLTYDNKVAFDWAKAHKMALKLDTSAFEKIVKADTPDFVKVSTEAIATIATELKVE